MMLQNLIIKKRFWFGLLLLPIPIHLLPLLNYIPDWREKKEVLYLVVFLLVITALIGSLILFFIKSSAISKVKRVLLSIITVMVVIAHCAVFFFIAVFAKLDLGSREVTLTEEVGGRTIYLFENYGLFHIHVNCEAAYKIRFLPLYKTYYSTSNHLELKQKGPRWILFNEYEKISVEKEIKDVYDLFKKGSTNNKPIKDVLLSVDNLN